MRTMQKFVCVLMAIALLLSLSLAVFADKTTPHTITVTNADAQETHEYSAYQVFSGIYDEPSGALTDVDWGSGVNGTALLQDLVDNIPDFAACTTAAQVVQVLATYADGSDELRAFAEIVDRNVVTPANAVATATADSPALLDVIGDGYYYVKDTTDTLTLDTYSDYILLVEGDVTVEAKDTTGVTSEKKVKDINDSTLVGSGWQDSADYDIGDPVPFKISGTVAADYDKYETYKLIFHDKESDGLTFDHITSVYVTNPNKLDDEGNPTVTQITEGYTVVQPGTETGENVIPCTFEVVFEDLKAIEAVEGGCTISVEYISILNEEAVIGVPGNPNEMCMEYSNNPTDESSTSTTPWDKVVVFTYEVIVDKVDENGELLPGADFELWKWYPDSEENTELEDLEDCVLSEDGETAQGEHGHWVKIHGEVNGEVSSDGNGKIVKINGKLANEYTDPVTGEVYMHWRDRLDETKPENDIYAKLSWFNSLTPEMIAMNPRVPTYSMVDGALVADPFTGSGYGYFLGSVERETTAGTTFSWSGVDDGWYVIVETQVPDGYNPVDPIVFEIIATHDEESEDPGLDPVYGYVNGEVFFEPLDENIGIIHGEIENHSGAVIPSTGGIGTILFYVLGGMLVLGAGAVLVVKKFSDAN